MIRNHGRTARRGVIFIVGMLAGCAGDATEPDDEPEFEQLAALQAGQLPPAELPPFFADTQPQVTPNDEPEAQPSVARESDVASTAAAPACRYVTVSLGIMAWAWTGSWTETWNQGATQWVYEHQPTTPERDLGTRVFKVETCQQPNGKWKLSSVRPSVVNPDLLIADAGSNKVSATPANKSSGFGLTFDGLTSDGAVLIRPVWCAKDRSNRNASEFLSKLAYWGTWAYKFGENATQRTLSTSSTYACSAMRPTDMNAPSAQPIKAYLGINKYGAADWPAFLKKGGALGGSTQVMNFDRSARIAQPCTAPCVEKWKVYYREVDALFFK